MRDREREGEGGRKGDEKENWREGGDIQKGRKLREEQKGREGRGRYRIGKERKEKKEIVEKYVCTKIEKGRGD